MSEKYRILLDAARSGEKIDLKGRKLEVVGASSIDALASIRFAYPNGSKRSYYEFSRDYYAESALIFDHIIVQNEAQAGEWIDVLVTEQGDDFKYSRREDFTISEISSPVEIKNVGGAELKVQNSSMESDLYNLDNRIGEIGFAQIGVALKTDLRGSSYANVVNATTEIVSSGDNDEGIIIRIASISTNSDALNGRILAGGNAIVELVGDEDGCGNMIIENLLIPSGRALSAESESATTEIHIHYEVL